MRHPVLRAGHTLGFAVLRRRRGLRVREGGKQLQPDVRLGFGRICRLRNRGTEYFSDLRYKVDELVHSGNAIEPYIRLPEQLDELGRRGGRGLAADEQEEAQVLALHQHAMR